MRLGHVNWAVVASLVPAAAALAFPTAQFFTGIFTERGDLANRLTVFLALGVGFYVLFLFLARLWFPQAYVDVASHRIRHGRAEFAWSELTEAKLIVRNGFRKSDRSLLLVLQTAGRRRIPFVLRPLDTPFERLNAELAALVVEGSSIAMPRAKEDPDGKYSRWNYPTNVSKEDALELLRNPPAADDPLPIPEGPAGNGF